MGSMLARPGARDGPGGPESTFGSGIAMNRLVGESVRGWVGRIFFLDSILLHALSAKMECYDTMLSKTDPLVLPDDEPKW